MTENGAIEKMERPNTRSSLRESFNQLGVEEGMVVIVHASLSAFGWVCGGPVAIIQALMDVVGESGTIVMPTQTADNSDPSQWENPPVPREWWDTIRDEMPAYDPQVTPTRGMGKIIEAFRTFPGVVRSTHPIYSFAAWGKHSNYIVSEQPLEEGFGEKTPLAKIYQLNGRILLLGVNHDSNTSLHYAEHAILDREKVEKGTAMFEHGRRVWKKYEEIIYDSDCFNTLGREFEQTNPFKASMIGLATCKLIDQRLVVDYAREWLKRK
ncbi:aminoglycoside N(3)-acetyltransferase [Radiobacillus sp. PE A8.2]|uniref:aminoglycoside N(3)-acetyltransferase n=1 Tax=Radiobacillus sp. PE A8.2 TaxID=3380349 RepID=UPI00389025A2